MFKDPFEGKSEQEWRHRALLSALDNIAAAIRERNQAAIKLTKVSVWQRILRFFGVSQAPPPEPTFTPGQYGVPEFLRPDFEDVVGLRWLP